MSSPNQDGKVLVQRRSGNTVTITVGRYTSEPSAPTDPTGGRQQTTYPYPRSTTTPAAPTTTPAAPTTAPTTQQHNPTPTGGGDNGGGSGGNNNGQGSGAQGNNVNSN